MPWSFLSFVDAHVPEGRLRKRWGAHRGRARVFRKKMEKVAY